LYHETKFLTAINFIFMKKLIVILSVLCFHGFAFGQGWQRILNDSFTVFSACNDYDGGYLLLGTFTLTSPIPNLVNLGVMKLDKNGNKSWVKTYSDVIVPNTPSQIIQTPDSNFLVSFESPLDYFALRKLDKNGNSLWFKTFSLNYSVVKPNKNELILTGKSQNTSGEVLLRINLQGDTISQKIAAARLVTFEVLNDGILGINPLNKEIVKLNFEGKTVWSRPFFSNFSHSVGFGSSKII
jgi:hypothetical protein